jgi:hypothetical protein
MDAADRHHPARGSELLIEHCAALDAEHPRPNARERLERIVGGYLARLLVGALSGRRSRVADSD